MLELHGETGDGCWNPKVCHRRRSHYRNRAEVNAKRRGQRVQRLAELPKVEIVDVAAQVPPVALLYLYRDKPKDAHLHAVAITVWQGDRKLAETQPIHCIGMTNRQVNQYLRQVLGKLEQQYGIRQFEPEIRMEPIECPIDPCPLKGL